MATIEEVCKKVFGNEEEKAAFVQAASSKESMEAFLSERGCDASIEELSAYLKSRRDALSDEELADIAGGDTTTKVIFSIATVGFGCGFVSLLDLADSEQCLHQF